MQTVPDSFSPAWHHVVKQVGIALRTHIFPGKLCEEDRNAYSRLIDLSRGTRCNLTVSDTPTLASGKNEYSSEITHMTTDEFMKLPYGFSHRIASIFDQDVANIAMHVLELLPRSNMLQDNTIIGFTITTNDKSYRFPLHIGRGVYQSIDLVIN